MAKRTLPCGEDELPSWEGKAFLGYLGEPSGVKESWRSGDGDRGRVTQARELRGQETPCQQLNFDLLSVLWLQSIPNCHKLGG